MKIRDIRRTLDRGPSPTDENDERRRRDRRGGAAVTTNRVPACARSCGGFTGVGNAGSRQAGPLTRYSTALHSVLLRSRSFQLRRFFGTRDRRDGCTSMRAAEGTRRLKRGIRTDDALGAISTKLRSATIHSRLRRSR